MFETNIVQSVVGTPQTIHVIFYPSGGSLFNEICQGVIAFVAICGAVAALWKRRKETPKVRLSFDETDLHCHVEEVEIDGEAKVSKVKRLHLRVGIENVGSVPANKCKIIMDDALIVSDGKVERGAAAKGPARYLVLVDADSCTDCEHLGVGETCYFTLGYICASGDSGKGDEGTTEKDSKDACIELHSKGKMVDRYLSHQSHLRIPLKVCSEGMSPEKYSLELNWKGKSVSAIGSVGSLSASVSKGK